MLREVKEALHLKKDVTNAQDFRRQKGHASAQDSINEIYEMKLFQLLNESAKGMAGGRRAS